MEMTGGYTIAAPRRAVWDALNDPEILKQSIPGCEEIERTSDTGFSAKVTAKVGPVKARFTGAVTLSDLDPPNSYRISGEGTGGAAGFAKGGAEVRLEDADDGGTALSYSVDAQIGGKLAQIGSRLINSTSKKLAGEFFDNFAQIVERNAAASNDATASDREEGSKEMTDDHDVEENVYPDTHWAVWMTGALALVTLILFITNL